MIIRKIDGKYELELSKEEYLRIAEVSNSEMSSYEDMYDLDEIENSVTDTITITEDMLDICDTGFCMWADDFWDFLKYLTDEECEAKNFVKEI